MRADAVECPDLEHWQTFLASGSPDATLAEHLEACAACGARVERLREHARLAGDLVHAVRSTAGAPKPAAAAPKLPGFEELREVHRGGQGVVYRAIQESTRRTVAVKVLLEGAFASSHRLLRFQREVELAASLDHPNIVVVHDSGETPEGLPYFVMEFVEGSPANLALRELADPATSAGRRRTLQLFAKICRAVEFAHQRGVLHRDLKPGNVLIDARGEPHVLDFGLAALVGADADGAATRLTASGEFMGTLAYASPEHVSGRPVEIDVRSDVYSLGVILYELLTGAFPYPVDGTPLEVVREISGSEPRPPSSWATRGLAAQPPDASRPEPIDEELDTIVLKALAKEKVRRYPSAGSLAGDVERYLVGLPIDAKRDSTWYVLKKALLRNKVKVTAAAGSLLVLSAAAVVSTYLWLRAERDRDLAVTQGSKADEISGFYRGMFASISPYRSKGQTVTVREVLREADARLASEPIAEPEAELELRRTLGRTYAALRLPGEAQPQLERALELARTVHGDRSLEAARAMVDLGSVLLDLRPAADTAGMLGAAREILMAAGEATSEDLARLESLLGALHYALGDFGAAEQHMLAARELARRAWGDPSLQLAAVDSYHAALLERRGRLADAETKMRRALAILRALGDSEVFERANALSQLATVQESRGRPEEASASAREAHAILVRLLGPDHPQTVRMLSVLALLTRGERLTDEVRELRAAALSHHPRLLGTPTTWNAEALENLARLTRASGELELAERLQRGAVAHWEALLERESYELARARVTLAQVLVSRGRVEEPARLCRVALEVLEPLTGPRSLAAALVHTVQASIALQRGDRSSALELAREALAIRVGLLDEGHALVIDAQLVLGWALYVNSLYGEAEDVWSRARDALARQGSDSTPRMATCLHGLGFTLLDQGRPGDAEGFLRAALDLRREFLGDEHPDLAETMNALGMALYYQRELDEVEGLWEGAVQILRRQGEDYPRTPWALVNLGAWRRGQGDLEGAEALIDEALERAGRTAPPDHPLLGNALANRAALHRARGEARQARDLLERAYETLLGARGAGHPHTAQVLQLLIAVCEEVGDTGAAERYSAMQSGG